jgi:pimeloyl-ACP methyl ester carboxylesterase
MITIFAIHGNGGGGFRFDRVRQYMPDDVRLVAPTLPGFASAPADPTLQTMADWAAHIRAQVKAESGPVVLLGTGIGGSFLLEYVQHYPAGGLILHAPVGTRLDSRRFPWLMSLPGARAFGQWLFSARITRPMFKQLLFVEPDAIPADYINRFFDEYRQCSVFGQMFDLITADWYRTLRPVDVPTALLWGEKERVLSTDHVQDYQQLFPENRVEIVPGWDHFPMIEQPAEYAETITTLAKALITGEAIHDDR